MLGFRRKKQAHQLSREDTIFFRSLGRALGFRTNAGVSVSEYTALNVPGVYACVSRIADSIAMLPWHVYQKQGSRRLPVESHFATQLLSHRPNPYMSAFTFFQTYISHMLLWGNGYAENELNARGETVGLWPLLPENTRPEKQTGQLLYRTIIDGTTHQLGPDRVAHLKALSHDGYVGRSPIRLAQQAVGLSVAMETFGAKLFENEARSGGFIQYPDQLSSTGKKNLEESVNAQGGLDNAHRIKVLEEGAKYIATTIPPEDAQFLQSREFQLSEFARMYNVPLVLLQSQSGSTVWGTGIESLMIGFVTYTLGPHLRQIELEFNEKLFTQRERESGLYVKAQTNALLRGDMSARASWYKSLSEIGVYTANDIRAFEDENARESLDTHYRPSNWTPMGEEDPEQ